MFMIPIGLYRKVEVNLQVYKEQQLIKGLDIGKAGTDYFGKD